MTLKETPMDTPATPALQPPAPRAFFGATVVRAAFVLAIFGWGIGFYSPAIFLHAVLARTGWALPLVSAAVTFHFLFGAGVVASMPGWAWPRPRLPAPPHWRWAWRVGRWPRSPGSCLRLPC
jgi:hypothetical protein